LGYINPNLFINREYGKELRKLLLDNSILQVIDFGDSGVFKDVTNYPCILVVQKKKLDENKIKTIIVHQPKDYLLYDIQKKFYQKEFKDDFFTLFEVAQNKLSDTNWILKPGNVLRLMKRLDKSVKTNLFGIIDTIHQGLITGDNSVFFINESIAKSERLEQSLLKKVPKGRNVRKYRIDWLNRWLIYPQKDDGSPYSENEFKNNYPNTYRYLRSFEEKLSKRKYYGKSVKQLYGSWFPLIHTKPKDAFETIKIVTPNLSKENNFALDNEDYYFDHDTYCILLKNKDESFYKYILGLLNSLLLEFYLKQISPYASGKYYRYMTGYLDNLPIKLPETAEQKKIANEIIKKVDEILELHKSGIVDIDAIMEGEETDKLHQMPKVAFNISDNAKFEKVKSDGNKIYINSQDFMEIKDKKIKDFVEIYFNFNSERLSKAKDVKNLILNISVPKSDEVLKDIIKRGGADQSQIRDRIKKLEDEINDVVYQIYGITKEERKIVEENL